MEGKASAPPVLCWVCDHVRVHRVCGGWGTGKGVERGSAGVRMRCVCFNVMCASVCVFVRVVSALCWIWPGCSASLRRTLLRPMNLGPTRAAVQK